MILGEFTLRAHQVRAIDEARRAVAECLARGEKPHVLIVAPCGAGKTVISSGLIAGALAKDRTALFMASGRQLIYQKSRTLAKAGIEHAVLMAGEEEHWQPSPVWVCSKDTYTARVLHSGRIERADHNLWIVDEAHRSLGGEWVAALPDDNQTVVIGFTATPALANGKGCGAYYKRMVTAATYAELLEAGLLVGCRVCAPWSVDTTGIKRGADGDWSWKQIEGRAKKLVGRVVETWKAKGEQRQTVCFAQGVEHAIGLCHEFNHAGIPAAHVDADTPTDERNETFRRLRNGDIRIVTNFGVLTVGWDEPCVSCGILAFATDSLVKFLQVVGRVLRPFDGKADALILDHGDNVRRFGWPTDDREWSLDPDQSIADPELNHSRKKPEPIICRKCGEARQGGSVCPACGHQRVRTGAMVVNEAGELVEIKPAKVRGERECDDLQKEWMRCLAICAHRGANFYAAKAIFTKRVGKPPRGLKPFPPEHQLGMPVGAIYSGFLFRRAKA